MPNGRQSACNVTPRFIYLEPHPDVRCQHIFEEHMYMAVCALCSQPAVTRPHVEAMQRYRPVDCNPT
jgi:hypothetical protein